MSAWTVLTSPPSDPKEPGTSIRQQVTVLEIKPSLFNHGKRCGDVGSAAFLQQFLHWCINKYMSLNIVVYLKQQKLKDPERYRKCNSAAQLSFRLITEKISKHTWESKMTGPGKFCRDLRYQSSLGAEVATAIVLLCGGEEKPLQSDRLPQRDGNATLRSLSSAGAWKDSENMISLWKNCKYCLSEQLFTQKY